MKKSFSYYKNKLDNLNRETNNNNSRIGNVTNLFDKGELQKNDESRSLDTVGAICLDMKGNFASAVSSGGILLKLPGRVGHARLIFNCF